MKWSDLRHVYYLKSSDFITMLSLLHVVTLILVGYGLFRISSDINDIQDNVWALIIPTFLFTITLAGSRRNRGKTYGRFHKWFTPIILLLSLITMISLSAYHGIITVLALHLVLISFSLTGFSWVLLSLINIAGISIGTSFQVVLVKRLYSDLRNLESAGNFVHGYHNLRRSISSDYGYGLANNSTIVFIDMGLLFVQVLGGLIFYSRYWKLGLTIYKWKSNPSFYINEFKLINKLENMIFNRNIYHTFPTATMQNNPSVNRDTQVKPSKNLKKLIKNPVHSSILPDETHKIGEMDNLNENEPVKRKGGSSNLNPQTIETTDTLNYNGDSIKTDLIKDGVTPNKKDRKVLDRLSMESGINLGKDYNLIDITRNKVINIKDYNMFVEDELEDVEWLKFLEENDKVKVSGKRTYSNERIIPHTFIDKNDNNDEEEEIDTSKYDFYNLEDFDLDNYQVSINSFNNSVISLKNDSELPDLRKVERISQMDNLDLSEISKVGLDSIPPNSLTITSMVPNSSSIPNQSQTSNTSTLNSTAEFDNENPSTKDEKSEDFNPNVIEPQNRDDDEETPNSMEDKEFVYGTNAVVTDSIHFRSYSSYLTNTTIYDTCATVNFRDKEDDKLLNINVNITNPFIKIMYLIMPKYLKMLMKRLIVRMNKLRKKRDALLNIRWTGSDTLPLSDVLHFFSYKPYEYLYIKWMHVFNRMFYNSTILEMILIVFYSLMGSCLLFFRYYLILSPVDQELFIEDINRLIVLSVRHILYPILSILTIIIVIILIKYNILLNLKIHFHKTSKNNNTQTKDDISNPNSNPKNNPNKHKKGKENKKNKREERFVLYVYWTFIILLSVDFIGSLTDVFVSLGLETPPYAVHNSLVMQFILTKTAAFLLLRSPTFFLLYIIYFVGLFICQFFLTHTQTIRYMTMQVVSQIVISVGTYSFLVKPIDINRRRIFIEIVLPYILYLSKFINV